VDSAIVDDRAPWSVKCSVVMNEIAAGRGCVATPEDFSSPSMGISPNPIGLVTNSIGNELFRPG
jgi:hypothetical protein